MNTSNSWQHEISALLQKNYPQLLEKGLQEEIMQVGKLMQFKEEEIIMDFGSYVKTIPLILKGLIKISRASDDGNEVFLYNLQPGDSCTMSFSCCRMDKKSEIRTVAEEESLVIAIPVHYMDEWMRRYQSWKNFVMISYDNRMFELIKTIESMIFKKMDERLLSHLQKKAAVTNSKVIEATHQMIASDLGASREAISRLLKQLEKDGKLLLGRNRITLI